jgi:hypothetical protein
MEYEEKDLGNSEKVMDFFVPAGRCTDLVSGLLVR